MFHDARQLRAAGSRRPADGQSQAIAAVEAFCSIGVESAVLSRRLFDNTQKLCHSAAMHKDAKDVSRTLGAFVNASYRDIAQNAEAVLGIWGRFLSSACSSAAFD
jgi:hypothetical protein